MGHWYPWATPEYLLWGLSWTQLQAYLFQLPAAACKSVFTRDPRAPDLEAIRKLRMGKVK